jgi:hypothetical protein
MNINDKIKRNKKVRGEKRKEKREKRKDKR